jgi:flagellar FliJ protein
MKKFRFQFETVERVRKTREDESLRSLGQAQALYNETLKQKEKLLGTLAGALERREALGSGNQAATVLEFQLESDFIAGTKVRINQQDQAILRARRMVEKALRTYLAARRQTRMMEMLREKAFGEYKIARNKHLQKQSDDLSIMRNRLRETA